MSSGSSTNSEVSVVEWEEEFLAVLGESKVTPTEHLSVQDLSKERT